MSKVGSILDIFDDFSYNFKRLTIISKILFTIPLLLVCTAIFILAMIMMSFMWADLLFRVISGIKPKMVEDGREH